MKQILIILALLIGTGVAQSQYQWVERPVPTTNDLNTAIITNNGDIYVFGDNAYGAKSSDNGSTWTVIPNLDPEGLGRNITESSYNPKNPYCIFVTGENKLTMKYTFSKDEWRDFDYIWYNVKYDIDQIILFDSCTYLCPNRNDFLVKMKPIAIIDDGQPDTGILTEFIQMADPGISPGLNYDYHTVAARGFNDVPGGELISFLNDEDMENIVTKVAGRNKDQWSDSWHWNVADAEDVIYSWGYKDLPSIVDVKHKNGVVMATTFFARQNRGVGLYSAALSRLAIEVNSQTDYDYIATSLDLFEDSAISYRGWGFNPIIVGHAFEGNAGFVRAGKEKLEVISQHRLNHVVSNVGKAVIVGDNGTFFITGKSVANKKVFYNPVNLKVFPSPSTGQFKVSTSYQVDDVKIFDVSGKLVQNLKPNSTLTDVNIRHLPDGLYVVQAGQERQKILKVN